MYTVFTVLKNGWRGISLMSAGVCVGLLFWLVSVVGVEAASGLVPCGGPGQMACQTCHVVELIDNVYDWVVGIMTTIFILIVTISGLYLATATGGTAAMTKVRRVIVQTTVGYAILLATWFVVGFFMALLLGGDTVVGYGPWRVIQCVDQPLAMVYHPTPGESRGVAETPQTVGLVDPVTGTIDPAVVVALAALNSPDAQVAAAAAANGLSPEQARNLQALMRVESGGCRNLRSPVGALGCMQVMPQTARQYDPALRGLTDAEVEARLLQQDYNIALGTRIYADLYRRYNGDTTRLFAGYNGGPGANLPSRDCPGLMRWQCEWNSPGCHETGRVDCQPNTGYRETRNYVRKVNEVAAALPLP